MKQTILEGHFKKVSPGFLIRKIVVSSTCPKRRIVIK